MIFDNEIDKDEIKEYGIVAEIKDNISIIILTPKHPCQSCKVSNLCGFKGKKEITIINDEGFVVGERVEIIIKTSQRLFVSFCAYIAPIILLFFFYAIFYFINAENKYNVLLSFLWFPFWLLFLYYINKVYEKKSTISVLRSNETI
jgi:positive regulator of sigma E activity